MTATGRRDREPRPLRAGPPRTAARTARTVLVIVVVVAACVTALWGTERITSLWRCRANDASTIAPEGEVLYGVNLDWASETLTQYARSLGHTPAVAAQFTNLPYTDTEWSWVQAAADQVRTAGGVLLLTLEPQQGLDAVDGRVVDRLASDLHRLNDEGTPVVLRLAHEMNGSWYAWSQQPAHYIEVFDAVAAAVHQRAHGTQMLWAPSYGGGYPFSGGQYAASPRSRDFELLDTNGDGVLDMHDDPYLPYYPGDDAVDWVGMSLYHWGNHYPWGRNEIPETGKLAEQLTGTYAGSAGDETALPDFYKVFGTEHARPVAITETAALYAPGRGGGGELALKQAWWRQVFSSETHDRFPMLKMINWFEWDKYEPEISGRVDWRALGSASIRAAYVADLPPWLAYGDDLHACTWGFG